MSFGRSQHVRLVLFVVASGVLAAGPVRPAQAGQEVSFRKEFTLSEACLQGFDALGAYWSFGRGKFLLEVSAWIGDRGDCFVSAVGVGSGSGLNYKLGTSASLSVLFLEFAECSIDPVDGVLRAKVPFDLELFGAGGGTIPSEMRLGITPSGVSITGVTIGTDRDD